MYKYKTTLHWIRQASTTEAFETDGQTRLTSVGRLLWTERSIENTKTLDMERLSATSNVQRSHRLIACLNTDRGAIIMLPDHKIESQALSTGTTFPRRSDRMMIHSWRRRQRGTDSRTGKKEEACLWPLLWMQAQCVDTVVAVDLKGELLPLGSDFYPVLGTRTYGRHLLRNRSRKAI